ncbi:hypothetical protein FACS1894116_07070 [Betaproteobacteria bacterium]|nr:hypothetical protein FACS1894116_07070 [Betaproteobacteria bacterium]GHU25012.1 hypothetical protein FACS189488_10940 [Betaproteobacteria bacterium]
MEAAVAHSLNLAPDVEADPGEREGDNVDEEAETKREALRLEIAKAQTELETLTAATAALKAKQVALHIGQKQEEIERAIDGYVEAGKLLSFEREDALTLAKHDAPALMKLLDTHRSIFIMQSDAYNTAQHAAVKDNPFKLNPGDVRACELTGRSQKEFAALKAQFFNGKEPVHV